MSVKFQCGDGAALIDYVYDEGTDETLVAAHVATCTTCADEVRALRATREDLLSWTPPDVALGFQVVPAASANKVLRPERWWRQPLPAWAQAAAAVVLFSTGIVLGTLRSAGMPEQALTATNSSASATTTSAAAPAAVTVTLDDLKALEARLRDELAQARGAVQPTTSNTDEAVLEQVRTLLRESERRQQQEVTLQIAEAVKSVDAQRRGDMVAMQRAIGTMEGNTGTQVESQRQILNYLMRVSQTPR